MRVEAEVRFTEDLAKVRAAILNIFPTIPIAAENREGRVFLVGMGENIQLLGAFRELIIRERIPDSARRVFRSNIVYGRIMVCLNKQVAAVKHISFCEPQGESPLGPIIVTMESDRIEEVVDWLAPRTFRRQSERGTLRTMKSSARMVSGKIPRARSRKPSSSGYRPLI